MNFVQGGVVTQYPLTKNKADIYSKGINRGLDIAVPRNTPIELPTGSWRVIDTFDKATAQGPNNKERAINQGYGNRVVVENMETGERISFAHLSTVKVRPGDRLDGGVIGTSGATGNTAGKTGQHVDIEYHDRGGVLRDITKTNYWTKQQNQTNTQKQPFSLVKPAMAAEKQMSTTIVPRPPLPQTGGQVQPIIQSNPSGQARLINRGETLSSIAKQYNTTWQNIAHMNPQIKNPNKIYAGDALYVPQPRVVAPPVKSTPAKPLTKAVSTSKTSWGSNIA